MASGKSSAHSKVRRPGKSNKVTITAVPMPRAATPAATHRHSTSVVAAYSGNTVRPISRSSSQAGPSSCVHDSAIASTGKVSASTRLKSSAEGKKRRSMGFRARTRQGPG